MNIWLKPVSLEDGQEYCDLLIELAGYEDAYARPVPADFKPEDFASFKKARLMMSTGIDLPASITQTNTYWVMDESTPIGYATLKHQADLIKPGGHTGCCLKKEYQNKGIGIIVADKLEEIAYTELGIEEVIYTSKNENEQSQRSVLKIGGELVSVHDGYHFYKVNVKKKLEERGMKI